MKNLSFLLLISLMACQPPAPADTSEQDLADVKEASRQYGEAIIAGDFEKIRSLAAANATIMPPGNAAQKGPDGVVSFMEGGPDVEGNITPSEFEVSGDLAVIRGNFDLTFQINDTTQVSDNGKYIEVWQRDSEGAWKMHTDIWNSNKGSEGDM